MLKVSPQLISTALSSATLARLSIFFITSALCPPSLTPFLCHARNHSQIVAAKRVPVSRGGQALPKAAFCPLFENQKQKRSMRLFPKWNPIAAFHS